MAPALLQLFLQLHAVHARHADIEKEAARGKLVGLVQIPGGIGELARFVAVHAQELSHAVAHRRIVIHDVTRRTCHRIILLPISE